MSTAIVIGAGPAGLMAAERLAQAGVAVAVYDAMPSAGRKFLLAGRGGLNITHSEALDGFISRYREASDRLDPLVRRFDPSAMQAWCAALGEPVFTGSSGRMFPKSFKASPLLRAWLRQLAADGVALKTGHRWTGFAPGGEALFRSTDGDAAVRADAVILALGGASWPRLGSTGAWTSVLEAAGVSIAPLRASNAGFRIRWSPFVEERHAGEPLKRIALSFRGESARGEAVITAAGLEGGAVYALSGPVRDMVAANGAAEIHMDLRPDVTLPALGEKLARVRRGDSLGNRLRKQAGLSPAAIAVLRDGWSGLADFAPDRLAAAIKALPLTITGIGSLDRAISSAGGVRWDALDDGLMLRSLPGVFCAGEMIDWEASTGGYLLQACFATGVAAAEGALRWISRTALSGA